MPIVVEVKFTENGRVFYFDASLFPDLKKNDRIVVDYNDVDEFAVVVSKPKEKNVCPHKLQKVLRVATEKDIELNEKWLKKSIDAIPLVEKSVQKYGLVMKLVDVKYNFGGGKLLITYTADDRVDFRELVRELASIFKTRIELRQIGLRDEAKLCGGCGPCGQELCCRRFLSDYPQVAIKMAKTQGLALNPSKINGVCGKLMCCLEYEYPEYKKAQEKMPPLSSIVECPDGEGEVVYHDLIKEEVVVKIIKEEIYELKSFKPELVKIKE